MRIRIGLTIAMLTVALNANAQGRVDKNIVYGMYSGLALLMDVHYPDNPNGLGVVFVSGSGWQAPLGYGATALKEQQIGIWGPPLLRAGYTVFAINHRAAPRFHYPAAHDDVQRAVRFVRHNAARYRVDAARLGGVGGSSGGHLIALAAMLGAGAIAEAEDAVDRESASLQAVVLRAAPSDLRRMAGGDGLPLVVSFMELPPSTAPPNQKAYTAASPIAHVSRTAPPVLLLHGDSDDTVPFEQSVSFEAALRTAGVPTKLIRVPGGEHGPDFGAAQKKDATWPDFFGETVRWLDEHLKKEPKTSPK